MKIGLDAKGFSAPYAGLNQLSELRLTWSELVWAAVTVGRASRFDVLRHGEYSLYELVYRIAMVRANLRELASHTLVKSDAYKGLDPSEKSAVSYFLGMALGKAFAEQKLSVPWLLHLDVYRDSALTGMKLKSGKSRPDLVGRTRGQQWVVLEPKGRTNGLSSNTLAKAKTQAAQVVSVDGRVPVVSAGLVAHFEDGSLQLAVDDPPVGHGVDRVEVALRSDEFFTDYYAPFRYLLKAAAHTEESYEDDSYAVVELEAVDVRLGVRMDIALGMSVEDVAVRQRSSSHDHALFLGPDGVLIELGDSWAEKKMMLEPYQRVGV